jgi:ATP-binding cassette, subfamily B, bacterial PglK
MLQIFKIFSKRETYSIFFIFFLMIINAFFEIFSLSLIVPFLSSMLDTENFNIVFLQDLIIFFLDYFNNYNKLLVISILLIFIFLLKNFFYTLLIWLQSKLIFNTQASISNKLLSSYLSKSISFHEGNNSSKLIRNAIIETGQFSNGILLPFLKLMTELVILFSVLFFLFTFNPLITFIFISIFLISILLYFIILKKNISIWGKKRQEFEAEKLKEIRQTLDSIKEINIYKSQDYFIKLFANFNNLSAKMNTYQLFFSSLPKVWLETISLIFIFIIVFFFSFSNNFNIETIPYLGMFVAISIRLLPSFSRILSSIQIIRFSIPSLNIVLKEINNSYYKKKFNKRTKTFKKWKKINILKINYKYELDTVLDNVNLEIFANDRIGISGKSGVGKTTLLYVLLGFYKPLKGSVLLDSQSIYDNLDDWQSKIGYVPQKINLLDDTIVKNIAFGTNEDDINIDKINQILKIVKLDEFVSSLTNGIYTTVGEMGSNISGGQIQRIGIARVLYKDPEIIMFDEASNAIDEATELDLIKTLFNVFENKTFILISHRKETLKLCNKIFDLSIKKML